MASETTLRRVGEQISKAIREFAETHGWPAGDYRLFLHLNEDWYTAHVILAAEDFGGGEIRDKSRIVSKFLKENLPDFLKELNAFNLTLRTFSQIDEGGIYQIGPEFVDLDELLKRTPLV
jgi:hypothetical protein